MSEQLARDVYTVCYLGQDRTVRFAAEELVKYLSIMLADQKECVQVRPTDAVQDDCAIWVGIDDDLRKAAGVAASCPAVDDKAWDLSLIHI